MLQGSEAWDLNLEDMLRQERYEASILCLMCNVSIYMQQSVSVLRKVKYKRNEMQCAGEKTVIVWSYDGYG